MKCPYCGGEINKVVDKRSVQSLDEIRRRRECLKCLKRFTTYEKAADLTLAVIKKDGRKEAFIREKLKAGIEKALEKRPALPELDDIVDKVERKIRRKGEKEIASRQIGQAVLVELKKLDMVAYLRFVSVYKQFKRPADFTKEVKHLEHLNEEQA